MEPQERVMAIEQKRYSPLEVREIIRRAQREGEAKEDEAAQEGLTQAELVEIGREVGLSDERLSAALVQYEAEQQIGRAERELRQIAYRRFSAHLILYVVLNGMLAAINLQTGPPLWFLVPLLLWGLFLLFHLRGVLFPDPDRLRERAQRRLERQRLVASSKQLGQALTRGATRLLSAAAKKIDDHTDRGI
jgi:hypothetical protein